MANRSRTRNLTLDTCFVAPLLAIRTGLLYALIAGLVKREHKFIERLNQAQLRSGQDSDGRPIVPGYTPFTKAIKRKKGQAIDRVTLYDTGSLYKSIYTSVFADQFEIDATDPKTTELTAKYGSGIFGLTDASMQALINYLRPLLLDKLRKAIL